MDNDSGSAVHLQDVVSLVLDVLRSQIDFLCGQDVEGLKRQEENNSDCYEFN